MESRRSKPSRILIAALLTWAGTTFPAHASPSAELFFDRPIFTQDRRFSVEPRRSGTLVPLPSESGLQVVLLEPAASGCGLAATDVKKRLQQLLARESTLWSALDLVFPNSRARTRGKNLTVMIDNFSSFSESAPVFASYFMELERGVIGLDCSKTSIDYWLPSLAHEITHALMEGSGAFSGWEEGVAQLMEAQVGGLQPMQTLRTLEHLAFAPNLIESARPLPSRQSYAISYLFARYMLANLGWPGIEALSSGNACPDEVDPLARLACRAQAFLYGRDSVAGGLSSEKLTRAGLLRFFNVALTMNEPQAGAKYSIPGWAGRIEIALEPPVAQLLPGQSIAFRSVSAAARVSPGLEIYRVLILKDGAYRILTRQQANQAVDPTSLLRDYYLVLNVSDSPQILFQ